MSVVGVRGGEKKDEGGGHVREGSKRVEFLKFYQLQRFGLISTHNVEERGKNEPHIFLKV